MQEKFNKFAVSVQVAHVIAPPLVLTYIATDNLPNGTPYLPDDDPNSSRAVVKRDGDRTTWRRIALTD